MDKAIIDGVHKIANHLYKKEGYLITINREDVAIVLEAFSLLEEKIEEGNNGETKNKDKG